MKRSSDAFLLAVDVAGTFLFAVEGAAAGARGHLDFFGIVVLAFVTAAGGGIIRDLLIGAVPPGAISDWRYTAIACAGAATIICLYSFFVYVPPLVLTILDAGGLALFAISGAGKALAYRIHPVLAVLMGGITAAGGGTVRDILLAQVPGVLRADIYAVAALAGAAVMVIGLSFKLSSTAMAITGGLVCFALRMVSVFFHWNLPIVAGN